MPIAVLEVSTPNYSCSCEEEAEAAKRAVRWICEESDADADTTVVIATDSQSMCKVLLAYGNGMDEPRKGMDDLPCKLILLDWT